MNLISDFDLATLLAVGILGFYSIIALAIFLYRLSNISKFYQEELRTLDRLLKNQDLSFEAYFKPCEGSMKKLEIYYNEASKNLSEGLTWLSIIATTSPFIGLFGTVVSIYFTLISLNGNGDITQIASPIGHALIATASGIISAILAYTFHLIVKRKVFECLNILESQIKIISNEK
ncbi:MotA/TolQ/ExbB proton channel family protein [Campylobacter sp. RM12640]|uniref:MotA/TolQ/ExbB proton channel family protein n=1 Tax=unclassified Campylobacter TaxID=2593542 RepID=UPI0030149898|nr:MotA/TolQ/ExbB proton channel family protein [Campylobacter sp. RM12640]MBZ7988462.1 MotA/TolQ/ExbB proton channel family protein [Campylobacter sp. RM12635]